MYSARDNHYDSDADANDFRVNPFVIEDDDGVIWDERTGLPVGPPNHLRYAQPGQGPKQGWR